MEMMRKTLEGEAIANEGLVQEQSQPSNFSKYTGDKINETCPRCWLKGYNPYNCGFIKCPGNRLFILEKSKAKEFS